jgi:3-deoxy-7-phosphoheptulonate synthase
VQTWSPTSWKSRQNAQDLPYEDAAALDRVVARIRELPPLVTSWEIDRLRSLIASAQRGERFFLQGGDCAETLDQCKPGTIERKVAILLKMSLVLILGGRKPVVRVGRIAGQYGKPRSKPFETRAGQSLPSWFGDLVNRPDPTPEARRLDPELLFACYQHAALTLNFVRSLAAGGFADLQHPEYWDMSFLDRRDLPAPLRASYQATTEKLGDALRFMEALGEGSVCELSRVELFTSHEGLHLHYESAQTKVGPGRQGHYDLTTHLPWIGERTRALSGAHVEFFRGIRNPIGVKLGPEATPEEVLGLCEALNPDDEPGRLVLVTRVGRHGVPSVLPPLIEAVARAKRRVLWVCDPMHGNTTTTAEGFKTRDFEAILGEVEATFDAHAACGTLLGGVHFELTGDDVTECIGGGIREEDLGRAYETRCDPRLNHAQALEMAFRIARRLRSP